MGADALIGDDRRKLRLKAGDAGVLPRHVDVRYQPDLGDMRRNLQRALLAGDFVLHDLRLLLIEAQREISIGDLGTECHGGITLVPHRRLGSRPCRLRAAPRTAEQV